MIMDIFTCYYHVIINIFYLLLTDLSAFICSFVFVFVSFTHTFIHSFPFVRPVSHLDAILGPLLQVRNNGVVPEVNEP